MTECCGVGATSKLAIGLATDTPTRMDFIHFYGERIIKTLSDGSSQTIRGTLDRIDQNVAEGMLHVRFRVQMWMTSQKNAILLPCMGGGAPVANVYTIGDALPACKVIVGPSGAPEETYDGCVVTDWVATGRKGENPIMLDIGFIGKTRVPAAAGTFFISQTNPAMTEGYVFPYPDGAYSVTAYTVLGALRQFPLFRLAMDYHVIDEFNQSVTATNLCPTDHELTFATSSLYSTCDSTTDLLSVPMSGDTSGGELIIDLERTVGVTTYKTIFDIANAKLIARDYDIKKHDFNRLPILARGYATAASAMLKITNISS